MAEQLIITPTTNAATHGTWTITGAWELRAGSHDTTEHLARGSTYPGNIAGFHPIQTDAANGYDPAPKMALIALEGGSNGVGGQTGTLSGGATSVLSVMATTDSATEAVIAATFSGLAVTIHGLADGAKAHVMIMYN